MKDKILTILASCKGRAGHYGITVDQLAVCVVPAGAWSVAGPDARVMSSCLVELERDQLVFLSCDSTHDKRMGGLRLDDGRSVILVSLRTPE